MAAPTSPYATSTDVALFQRNLLRGGSDFSPDTPLSDTTIDTYISWVSSAIEMRFNEAGYVIPFAVYNSESWPAHQTTFLTLLTCFGTVALINPALKPSPAMSPGQKGTGNVFREFYEGELNRIFDGNKTSTRFRADHYLGSPAEKMLVDPATPISDWSQGRIDKTKYQNLSQFTETMSDVNTSILSNDYLWDYMYSMFSEGYGLI